MIELEMDQRVAAPVEDTFEPIELDLYQAVAQGTVAVVEPENDNDARPGVVCDEVTNPVDATRGQPLGARVLQRKNELEDALADLRPSDVIERRAIETALTAVYSLITCDIAHPPPLIARAFSKWLERHKYLAWNITRRQQASREQVSPVRRKAS